MVDYPITFDSLWDDLVPESGEAETLQGELIRCIGKLSYEYWNNGYANYEEYKYRYNHEHTKVDSCVNLDTRELFEECDDNLKVSQISEIWGNCKFTGKQSELDHCCIFDDYIDFLTTWLDKKNATKIERLRLIMPLKIYNEKVESWAHEQGYCEAIELDNDIELLLKEVESIVVSFCKENMTPIPLSNPWK